MKIGHDRHSAAAEVVLELGVSINATVVCVIIRDFIHLTERLSSADLLSLMSDYYEKIGLQVMQQQGTLTSISNHSVTIVFPEVSNGDCSARRALRCALAIAMITYQTRFWIQKAFPQYDLDAFCVGIGIHNGELVSAELGATPNVLRVVSGHAVSIASLLSVKSKELGWSIVSSEQAANLAGHGVRVRRKATIGAEWLEHPVGVVEIEVVGDSGDEPERTLDELPQAMVRHVKETSFPFIPGYRCLQLLGAGSMGKVLLAERAQDGARLAIKLIEGGVAQSGESLYYFVEEYGLLGQIKHPNVMQVYEQGVTDDAMFIVVEYLPGGNLKQLIGTKGMVFRSAWKVLREMAQALVEVHRLGIIHRDIKPENVLLRANGSAVLGDFGVAQQLAGIGSVTMVNHVVGTPYYMSPEQATGIATDARTDIYSLGCVFYNMLTGEKPYLGDSLAAIVFQHQHSPFPILPVKFRHLQPLLGQMTAKKPEQRPHAHELLCAMDSFEKEAGIR